MTRRSWTILCVCLAGCQQQMADQPAYRPLEKSSFFSDGRASRPSVLGTVATGALDDERYDPRRLRGDQATALQAAALVGLAAAPWAGLSTEPLSIAGYVDEFPMPVTRAMLERGRERFTIYCAVCHGADGGGSGPVVERGYTRPPSLIDGLSRRYERRGTAVALRGMPAGYYVAVMSEGFGAMASYSAQVRPADRWAIAAYIRALQLSQSVPLRDLPDNDRRAASAALEKLP